MRNCEREITKEEYEKVMAVNKNGYVVGALENQFFTMAQLWGYGVYSARVSEENGKYMLRWESGDSCD